METITVQFNKFIITTNKSRMDLFQYMIFYLITQVGVTIYLLKR